MFIKSSLNGYCLTAYADPPGAATYKVLNSPQTNELLDFQLWCVQMYDGGNFTIASKAAPQQMMSSGSGLQSQLLRLETNSSPAPPSQLLWTYDAQTGAGNDGFIKATLLPGNVLDIVGSSSSEEAQVQLCAQNGGPNQCFSFEPIPLNLCTILPHVLNLAYLLVFILSMDLNITDLLRPISLSPLIDATLAINCGGIAGANTIDDYQGYLIERITLQSSVGVHQRPIGAIGSSLGQIDGVPRTVAGTHVADILVPNRAVATSSNQPKTVVLTDLYGKLNLNFVR
eukprot:Em0003g403a